MGLVHTLIGDQDFKSHKQGKENLSDVAPLYGRLIPILSFLLV